MEVRVERVNINHILVAIVLLFVLLAMMVLTITSGVQGRVISSRLYVGASGSSEPTPSFKVVEGGSSAIESYEDGDGGEEPSTPPNKSFTPFTSLFMCAVRSTFVLLSSPALVGVASPEFSNQTYLAQHAPPHKLRKIN